MRILAKHALAAGFYLAFALGLALVWMLCLAQPAWAYVDPSVVTYAIQAIAGVAVAISAVAGVAFRRTRQKVYDLLGIDPDSNKDRDPAFARFDGEDPEALHAAPEAPAGDADGQPAARRANARREPAGPYAPKWRMRAVLGFVAAFMALGTLIVIAPLELIGGSTADFSFTPAQVAPWLVLAAAVGAVLVALVLSVLRGRGFLVGLALVAGVGLCFWLQAMFLDTGLPLADGDAVEWDQFASISTLSTVVWAVVLVALVALSLWRQRLAQFALMAVTVALLVVQGVGALAVVTNTGIQAKPLTASVLPTEEGLLEVSPEQNVIVFVLDTLDIAYFDEAAERDPAILDGLTGFTWYTNPVGAYIPTRYGIPFLLTGERAHEGDTWSEFRSQAFVRSPFLHDLHSAGYSVGIYSTNLGLGVMSDEDVERYVVANTLNIHEADVLVLDVVPMLLAMGQASLYRDLPWALKPSFWFTTDQVSSAMVGTRTHGAPEETAFIRDDAALRDKFRTGIGLEEEGDYTGSFRFYHLDGSHSPFRLDSQGNTALKRTTRIDQTLGALRIVEEYFDQLRELGVYDDATIIITADHGSWYLTNKHGNTITAPTAPVILAKPSQTAVEAAQPIQKSNAPVMHDDVLPTVIDAIGGDTSAYAGKSLFSYTGTEDPNATRLYNATYSDGHHDVKVVEWAINGDVSDFANWSETGREWDVQE